jgi:hypothetical protein
MKTKFLRIYKRTCDALAIVPGGGLPGQKGKNRASGNTKT